MAGLEELRAYGANVDEGVKRCVNNEDFYLKMVRKAMEDQSVNNLEKAINEKNLDQAFEIAHALKSVLANLALTPLSNPVSEIVELLRNRTDTDYNSYIEKIKTKREELKNIMQ